LNQVEQRERERLATVARNKADAAPVVAALRDAGFVVDTVAELFNKKLDYQTAIPILVEWLRRVANPDVKQDIVRALSVKWARHAAPLLLAEFERADDPTGTGVRWAIGNALEVLAGDEIADGMIKLAMDRRHGRAREMVVVGLGKLKDPRVADVLMNLLADDEVVGHAVMALGKLRARMARSRIEPLLNHPKPWVRKEAKKALANIDKTRAS
jgi:HEAT repeat protein